MTHITTITAGTNAGAQPRRRLARGTAIGIAFAAVANTAVFALGTLGDPIRVVTGWEPDGAAVRLVDILVASIAWVVIGAAALWILERLRADGYRIWVVAATTVAGLSIVPLFRLDIDTRSKVALSVMHLIVGASVIAGQTLARRTRP